MADDARGDGLLGRIREWLGGLPLVTPQFVSDAQETVPHHPEDVRSPARRFEVRDSYIEIEAGSPQDEAGLATRYTRYPMSISEVLTMSARQRRGPLPPAADTSVRVADRLERRWAAEIIEEDLRVTSASDPRPASAIREREVEIRYRSHGGTTEEWLSQASQPRMTMFNWPDPAPDTAARTAFARAQAEIAIQVYARLGISCEEFQETLVAISRIMGETYESPSRQITPESRERARALFRGLLTDGERRVFEECGYVPVVGSESGDLWLVTGKPVYNLVRYEQRPCGHTIPDRAYPGKPVPVTWCAAAAAYAPVEDLTSSLLIALRSAEPRVVEVANRLPFQSDGDPSWPWQLLRQLAVGRCSDERLVDQLVKAGASLRTTLGSASLVSP